uniref:TPR_REGION domain-containing protein n=1 Tax=Dracunculus medinensis TaxID=318479 RepID=A0A158Q362_DRAME
LQDQTVSTWVSVTAKGVNFEEFMDMKSEVSHVANAEPVCPDLKHSSLVTLDHLPAYRLHDQFIFYKPEKALTDAFQGLGNGRERMEQVASRIANAMSPSKKNRSLKNISSSDTNIHWTLSTASTLYWRVKGDAVNAIKCLRHSLNNSPADMKDISLLSMANIYHQAGFLHSALIACGSALGISPNLVAIHFTLANIYSSMADYNNALQFYYSTLSLQSNFEPAKERIRIIYCNSGQSVNLRNRFEVL